MSNQVERYSPDFDMFLIGIYCLKLRDESPGNYFYPSSFVWIIMKKLLDAGTKIIKNGRF